MIFMANLAKTFFFILFCFGFVTSCGKKNGLIYPGGEENTQARKFEKVIEGYGVGDSDKNFKYYYDRKQPKKVKKDIEPVKEPLFNYSKTFSKSPTETTNQYNGQQGSEYQGQHP